MPVVTVVGIQSPSDDAVAKAVTKNELALHCRRRTRNPEEIRLRIDELIEKMKALTCSVGLPVLREEMAAIWQEQQRHLHCISDVPEVQLYTITGSLKKAGVELPTYRCGRGSTSLESFHLHLNRYVNRLSMNRPSKYEWTVTEIGPLL